jgi:CheY-like chemotaxis protein
MGAHAAADPFLRLIRKRAGKVLVVDDDPVMREMMGILLSRGGIDYRSVCNGEEAVEVWEREDFFVILMDLQMPKMNGLEATEAIRARETERGGKVPIVAVTAYATPGDDVRCRDAGMDDYITKPIDFEKFYSVIDTFARQRATSR